MKLDEIDNYRQLEKIIEDSSWQKFERLIGNIFKFQDYEVEVSKVIHFDDTKRQYDVIAEKDYLIVVDCKKWDNKRRKKYSLKKAVEEQMERVEMLPSYKEKYPILVLSCQTPMKYHRQVPIIPVHKLNAFLHNFQENRDEILSI